MKVLQWFEEQKVAGFNLQQSFARLTFAKGIKVKEYTEEGLFVLNYCQIESPKTDPVVMECRGLILDYDLNVVARPFDRFFNYGEALNITEGFNFEDANIFEKADGSLIKIYYHRGQWHIGTRGTAFAEYPNYTDEIFSDMVLKAMGFKDKNEMTKIFNRSMSANNTYIFEFTSPLNRIVTPYKESCMVLLAIRDKFDGAYKGASELTSTIAGLLEGGLCKNVRAAKTFSFSSQEDMQEVVRNLGGLEEGFVCFDKVSGIRIKLKSPKYVAVHKIRGESIPTPKRIAELVVTNEAEEYLFYFKEDRTLFDPLIDAFEGFKEDLSAVWESFKEIEDQKEFAFAASPYAFSGLLFAARKKGSVPLHEFSLLPSSKKVRMFLNYKGDG